MQGKTLTRRAALSSSAAMAAVLPAAGATAASSPSQPVAPMRVKHGFIDADGVRVFYREAGGASAPVLLLLQGFANSSFYFRHLMPRLADRYRVIAPDLPSFGFTEVPAERRYRYDFHGLTQTIRAFVDALGLKRFAMYVFDYGAPVGFNLALAAPERVVGFVSQNGNAYVEGLGEAAWRPVRAFWHHQTAELRETIKRRFTFAGVRDAYFHGVPDPSEIEPEAYWLDAAILARPGNDEIQLGFKLDYRSNIERYPLYQAYFRERAPRLLAIWGRNDPFFIPAGAEAYRRDLPHAEVRLLDTGHFALETHLDAIAAGILGFDFGF